jgi:hypothetical protein
MRKVNGSVRMMMCPTLVMLCRDRFRRGERKLLPLAVEFASVGRALTLFRYSGRETRASGLTGFAGGFSLLPFLDGPFPPGSYLLHHLRGCPCGHAATAVVYDSCGRFIRRGCRCSATLCEISGIKISV